ncbi:MAG: FKBP-type peptidyl-prolyl cis-trans isomerase [Phycisphaerae bacterium]|nr:FKBP-type peptidyl-prolyl cis-trans isomerase [Phycisphaerae bacterium]
MEALKANAEKGRTAMNEAKERPMRDLIAKLESETGKKFVKRDSGLMILMEKEGDGAQPTLESTVSTHYKGTLLDGTQFDSSYDRGSPTEFPLGNVIKGWQEGIAQMKKGGKAHLIIPPDLAYGARGAGGKIGPNATLYFQVELLDVK